MSPDREAQLRAKHDCLPASTILDIGDDRADDLDGALFSLDLAARGHDFAVVEAAVRKGRLCLHVRAPTAPEAIQKALKARCRHARFAPRRP